jgi:hypothetical protein
VDFAINLFRRKIERKRCHAPTPYISPAYLRTRGSQQTNRLLAVFAKWTVEKIKWTKKT